MGDIEVAFPQYSKEIIKRVTDIYKDDTNMIKKVLSGDTIDDEVYFHKRPDIFYIIKVLTLARKLPYIHADHTLTWTIEEYVFKEDGNTIIDDISIDGFINFFVCSDQATNNRYKNYYSKIARETLLRGSITEESSIHKFCKNKIFDVHLLNMIADSVEFNVKFDEKIELRHLAFRNVPGKFRYNSLFCSYEYYTEIEIEDKRYLVMINRTNKNFCIFNKQGTLIFIKNVRDIKILNLHNIKIKDTHKKILENYINFPGGICQKYRMS